MSTFTIRTDVPVPKTQRGRVSLYPFDQLDVGHSFYVPRPAGEAADLKTALARMQRTCIGAQNRLAPAKFIARIENDGVGVWRTQ